MTYILNVVDYGADPTGVADSAGAIQDAFDDAFGTSGSPHGSADAADNQPVFFPNGSYKVNSSLTLTKVVGGRIFGAGMTQSGLASGVNAPILITNGCSNLIIEQIGFQQITRDGNQIGIDLDWDGVATNCDGLHNNVFRDVGFGNCQTGIRLGHSNNDGANNFFEGCSFSNNARCIHVKSPEALNNSALHCVAQTFDIAFHAEEGQIHLYSLVIGASAGTPYAVQIDTIYPCNIIGGRSEGCDTLFQINDGILAIRGHVQAGGTEFIEINGGKVTIDTCVITNGGGGEINGAAGSLYLRGNSSFIPFDTSGFSGTIVQNI